MSLPEYSVHDASRLAACVYREISVAVAQISHVVCMYIQETNNMPCDVWWCVIGYWFGIIHYTLLCCYCCNVWLLYSWAAVLIAAGCSQIDVTRPTPFRHWHQSLTIADLDSLDDCSSQDVNACHDAELLHEPATQTVRRVVKLVMSPSDVICCLVILWFTTILIKGRVRFYLPI